jgi:hypothetical protein
LMQLNPVTAGKVCEVLGEDDLQQSKFRETLVESALHCV